MKGYKDVKREGREEGTIGGTKEGMKVLEGEGVGRR
jgi:hypothetical protein